MDTSKNTETPKTSLTQKLGKALENLSVDVFGIEQKVTRNIQDYLKILAGNQRTTTDLLFIKILMDHNQLRIYLYHKGKRHRTIPVEQLIQLFIGTSQVPEAMKKRIHHKIISFIQGLANKHQIPATQLQLCIAEVQHQVKIEATDFRDVFETIPLKTLIQYFQ